MPEISMLYDRSETDELGIRLTAEEMGVELGYLPFYKVSVGFDSQGISYRSLGKDYTEALRDTKVILNRTQSKGRRIYATTIMEAAGKQVLNPLHVEATCQSKVRTLLALMGKGVLIPRTVYVPCNAREESGKVGSLDNTETVCQLIEQQLGSGRLVVKPDAGTHGSGVSLAVDHEALTSLVGGIEPSITNPSGVVAQELVPKWFYDLRILVFKQRGRGAYCPETALVRAGFKEFRTNTFLGNMVFRARLPKAARRDAVRSGEIIAGPSEAWVIALDAMPYIGDDRVATDAELISRFAALEEPFSVVKKAKANPNKKTEFRAYSKAIEDAYTEYMSTEAYGFIQGVIQESLDKVGDRVMFHEGNSCPEFWEQTRVVGGINVAEHMLRCAESMVDA
ncbi:MAG: hypothetical protein V1924_04675 [Candidatus Bathyarchaeota archaeon]